MLEDNFGQPSGVGIAIGDVNRNSVMATDEMSLIVLSGFELCLLKEYGLGDQVAGSGCAVTVGHFLAFDIREGANARVCIGNNDGAISRLPVYHHGGKGFNVTLTLGHHIGQRTKVSQVNSAKTHGFDHGGVIGGNNQFYFLTKSGFQVILQRLVSLDQF